MVSKRFRALCLALQLAKEVNLTIDLQADRDAALSSLLHWLGMNSLHLTTFSLDICKDANPTLIMGCLTACCAAAPVEELTVDIKTDAQLPTLAWLVRVRSTLRVLCIELPLTGAPLTVDMPLQQFTALQSMTCTDLTFARGCRLPSSLTYLHLKGLQRGLPSQVTEHIVAGAVCLKMAPPHTFGAA